MKQDQVSIIIPVHNEKLCIDRVLKEWHFHLQKSHIIHTFIICEDGSVDGTKELLPVIEKKYPCIISSIKTRRGYGGAVLAGINLAQTNFILCIDSDGQCDPGDFLTFWQNRYRADVISGYRYTRQDNRQRKFMSKIFKLLFLTFFPIELKDPSAPYVLFKKIIIIRYIKYLRYLREGFWWNFMGMCYKKHLFVLDYPINHRVRFGGKTVVYRPEKIPGIALRNGVGLLRLWFAA